GGAEVGRAVPIALARVGIAGGGDAVGAVGGEVGAVDGGVGKDAVVERGRGGGEGDAGIVGVVVAAAVAEGAAGDGEIDGGAGGAIERIGREADEAVVVGPGQAD